jgi:simple sugar transport system substrate-binding protein
MVLKKFKEIACILLAVGLFSLSATATEKETYSFLIHSSSANSFWQAVNFGMQDACKMINADCKIVALQNDGNLQEQLTNLETTIAQKPTGIITTIVNDTIFDNAIRKAINSGIPVLSANVDDSKGAAGNSRLAFIGQNFDVAGYELGKAQSKNFPAGNIHVLLGVSGPGQGWAERRIRGVVKFLKEFKMKNPKRKVTWEKIDSGTDLSITGPRVAAYVQANPKTNAYFDAGFWHAGAANSLRDLGKKPGDILLAGFDVVPVVLDEMKKGWIQVAIDQQPYLQGFLPIMQLHLMKKYNLSAWDVDTGKGIVTKANMATIQELSKKGYR